MRDVLVLGGAAVVVLAFGVWALVAAPPGEEEEPEERRRSGAVECGEYEVPAGPPVMDEAGREAQRCLVDAFERGRRARLQVTSQTIEGDPIVDRYEVFTEGRVRWTHDASRDRFGGHPPVERKVCDEITVGELLPELSGCRPRSS